jgi:hypothetical protein
VEKDMCESYYDSYVEISTKANEVGGVTQCNAGEGDRLHLEGAARGTDVKDPSQLQGRNQL